VGAAPPTRKQINAWILSSIAGPDVVPLESGASTWYMDGGGLTSSQFVDMGSVVATPLIHSYQTGV
jgi:hypothetical protein